MILLGAFNRWQAGFWISWFDTMLSQNHQKVLRRSCKESDALGPAVLRILLTPAFLQRWPAVSANPFFPNVFEQHRCSTDGLLEGPKEHASLGWLFTATTCIYHKGVTNPALQHGYPPTITCLSFIYLFNQRCHAFSQSKIIANVVYIHSLNLFPTILFLLID